MVDMLELLPLDVVVVVVRRPFQAVDIHFLGNLVGVINIRLIEADVVNLRTCHARHGDVAQ